MKPILPILLPVLCFCAFAQNPPLPPRVGQPLAPLPKPGEASPNPPQAEITLTLESAIQRARIYSQQVYSANYAAQLAHEDAVQAKAALLPTVNTNHEFIYTQPNLTPTGIFVGNNGPHEYIQQLNVHGDVFNPVKLADYRRSLAAAALARARADLAARGLIATVTQDYYGMVSAQRKVANARASVDEAQQFLDITQKLEQGGEAAHVDVIKAQIPVQQRQRELEDAQLNFEKARITFSVLLFPNYGQPYTVTDDLENAVKLPSFDQINALARFNSPDIRVAQTTVEQQNYGLRAARAGYLPNFSVDYFYGIDSNQFALHDVEGNNLLGSAVVAQVQVPVWNWFSTRSKVRQAEIQVRQAQADLSLAQRTLASEIDSFYLEAQTAAGQLASLRSTLDLSVENLRLTRLRYTAGESTAQEVVDAQVGLVTARNAYDDGLVRYRVAVANLQTLTGTF